MSNSEAVVIQLSRPDVYVNSLSFGGADAVAAALSSNYIHVIDLEAKKSKKTLDVANNIVGCFFDLSGAATLRAFDDSFGTHFFDIRSWSKKKSRLNPSVESHSVTCSAVSDNYIALASSCFIPDEKLKKEKAKAKKGKTAESEEDSSSDEEEAVDGVEKVDIDMNSTMHVISIYDIRGAPDPILTIKDSHSDSINCMSFMRDGKHLITGGADGLINILDVSQSNEADSLKSTIQADSSVGRVGYISKRLLYGITDDNICIAMSPNSPEDVDVLFRKKPTREEKFVVDVLKGYSEEKPLTQVESDADGNVYLVAVSGDGKKSEVVEEWSGHGDIVRSTAYNNGILVTGGEDGKVVVKRIDLRGSATGKSKKESKKKHGDKPY